MPYPRRRCPSPWRRRPRSPTSPVCFAPPTWTTCRCPRGWSLIARHSLGDGSCGFMDWRSIFHGSNCCMALDFFAELHLGVFRGKCLISWYILNTWSVWPHSIWARKMNIVTWCIPNDGNGSWALKMGILYPQVASQWRLRWHWQRINTHRDVGEIGTWTHFLAAF